MKYIFLTEQFYADYVHCTEIEQKQSRPYVQLVLELDGITFAIPLRSNIHHKYVLWSDKEHHCGLDFSKAVVVTDPNYIDRTKTPYLRQNEYKALKNKEHFAKQKLQKYIHDDKRAKKYSDKESNQKLLKYSALQYFEEYL